MKILELEQGTEEWLDWRRGKCTASDAAVIMDEAPSYASVKTWEDLRLVKAGLELPPSEFTERAFKHGNEKEALARQRYAPLSVPTCVVASFHHKIAASLDGLEAENKIWHEIKSPISGIRSTLLRDAKSGKVPPHVWWQLVHQAGVINDKEYRCRLIVFIDDPDVNSAILEIPAEVLLVDWPVLSKRWSYFMENKKQYSVPVAPSITRKNASWIKSILEI